MKIEALTRLGSTPLKLPRSGSKRSQVGLRSRTQFAALETRTLYSADLGLAGAFAAEALAPLPATYGTERSVEGRDQASVKDAKSAVEGASDILDLLSESDKASLYKSFEIVLIDSQVPDLAALRDDFQRQIDAGRPMAIMIVDSRTDGIDRISQMLALAGREVTAIHIVSHGEDGELTLGATKIDSAKLEARSASIANWSKYLSQDADILIYGCDIASSAKGAQFVTRLGELSGADVAASQDITGAQSLGGNWDLEYHSGQIEHAILPSSELQAQWQALLATSFGPTIVADGNGGGDQRVGPVENGKHISVNTSGNIVIAWQDSGATQVTARLFSAYGSPRSGELVIFNPGDEGITDPLSIVDSSPVVAMREDGTFVVAWVAAYTGKPHEILAQRFTAEGLALGPRINVAGNSATPGLSLPDIDIDASGGFVITYTGITVTNNSNVYVSGFNSDGTTRFQNVTLGVNSSFYEGDSTVAVQADGSFKAAWVSYFTATSTKGIYAQTFDSAGVAIAAHFQVNSSYLGDQNQPSIESAADGSFAISYTSDRFSSNVLVGTDILMQRFNANGSKNGSEMDVAGADGIWAQSSALTVNSSGEISVVWSAGAQANGSYAQIYSRGYNGFGILGGSQIALTSNLARTFTSPSIASNGNIVVADYSITPGPITGPTDYGVRLISYIDDTSAYASIAPVNSVPLPQNTLEETTLDFTLSLGNAFQISDSDAGGQQLSVRLVSNAGTGALRIANPGGVFDLSSGLALTGPITGSVLEFKGTVAQLNAALAQLRFAPTSNFVGATAIQITTTELYGSGLVDQDSVMIDVMAVNDAPTINLPIGSFSVPQGSIVLIGGVGALSVDDLDSASSNITVKITASHGLPSVASILGVTETSFSVNLGGNNVRSISLVGTRSAVNAALQTLRYEADASFEGIEQILVRVDDNGNTGTGGNLYQEAQFDITVTHVNKPPLINIGPSAGALDEDSSATISTLFGSSVLTLSDIDAGTSTLDLHLSVLQGALTTLTTPSGLINLANLLPVSTPLNAFDIHVRGSLADLNQLLADLHYAPNLNYSGLDTLTLNVDDRQMTPQSTASASRSIAVTSVNDPPTANIGTSIAPALEDSVKRLGDLFTSLSISDIDAGMSLVEVTIFVSSGTLTLDTSARSLFDSTTNSLSGLISGSTIVFRGTIAAINAALPDIQFTPPTDANGSGYSVTLNVSDLGNTGAGSVGLSSFTRAFTVSPVNDAPTIAIGAQVFSVLEDSTVNLSSLFASNLLEISDVDAASGAMQFLISVDIGTLRLDTTGLGLSDPMNWTPLNGVLSGQILFIRGSLANLNTALAAIDYQSQLDSSADITLTLVTDDLGNTGSGYNQSASITRTLSASSVNDKPVITLGPQSAPVLEDTAKALGQIFSTISIFDVDLGVGELKISVAASNGTLSLDTSGRGLFDSSGNVLSGTITGGAISFNASLVNANNALAFVLFKPNLNANGTGFSVTLSADDQGNTGLPNPLPGPSIANGAINVTAVNDPAVWTLATTPLAVQEDSPTPLSSILPTMYVSDVDSGTSKILVSIAVNQGSLSLDTSGKNLFDASTGLSISGTLTGATLTFQGQKTAINAIVGQIVYTPPANANGSGYQLVFNVDDLGNSGLQSAFSVPGPKTRTFSINAVNDAPTLTAPMEVTGIEDLPLIFSSVHGNAISLDDVDGDLNTEMSLSVSNGTLSLAQMVGLTFTQGDGASDATLRFTGKVSDITAALNGLRFTPDPFFAGDALLSLNINDQGNVGSGGAKSAQRDMTLHINAVNNAPQIQSPTLVTAAEDTALVFSLSSGNQISVGDPDGDVQVALSLEVTHGTLTLASTAGLQFSLGDGQGDSKMRVSGKIGALNTALNGLSFLPDANFNGTSQLSIGVDDQGNVGSGGSKSHLRSIDIVVRPVNDLPVVQLAKAFTLQGGDINTIDATELLTTDIESNQNDILYTLDANPLQGAFLLHGVELKLGDSFTQADVNAGGIVYKAAPLASGHDQIKLSVRDRENSNPIAIQLHVDVSANPNYTSGTTQQSTGSSNTSSGVITTNITTSNTINSVKTDAVAKATTESTSLPAGPQAPGVTGSPTAATGASGATSQNTGDSARANRLDLNSGLGQANSASAFAQNLREAPRMLDSALPQLAHQPSTPISLLQSSPTPGEAASLPFETERPMFSAPGISLPVQNLSLDRMVADNSFQKNIEKVRDDVMNVAALDRGVVASTIGVSASFTIGYILWLVRGGVLISSLLASLPAWRMVDPLPVLGRLGDSKAKDDNDKSLEELVEQNSDDEEFRDEETRGKERKPEEIV